MTNKQQKNLLCVDDLRHAEYYQMQTTFDDLYSKSKNGEKFQNLMLLILSRENILLAYRNIKSNGGSKTQGTDNVVIDDIGKLSADEYVEKLRFIVAGSKHGYRPKAVRRKEIPKPNGKLRPLGIPCMWDRLVQQCIKQVMEPICEAKFSENSYGFRPLRSVEHAIQRVYQLKLKEQREEYRRVCGRCYNKKYLEYICVDEMGTLISPHYLTASFPKLLEKNNLRHIRFHDLRHSCASLLLANGVPMKQIQEWLGHSDFSTTANVYAHLDYNSKLSSADAMVNGLSGALEVIS